MNQQFGIKMIRHEFKSTVNKIMSQLTNLRLLEEKKQLQLRNHLPQLLSF